jgi:hypothetical protein
MSVASSKGNRHGAALPRIPAALAELSRRVRLERSAGPCERCGTADGAIPRILPDGLVRSTGRDVRDRAGRLAGRTSTLFCGIRRPRVNAIPTTRTPGLRFSYQGS